MHFRSLGGGTSFPVSDKGTGDVGSIEDELAYGSLEGEFVCF